MAGLLNLVADAAHNFTDGLAIAASFMVSPQVRSGHRGVLAGAAPPYAALTEHNLVAPPAHPRHRHDT